MRKVGENVNLKKKKVQFDEHNKKVHFLFLKQKERENINNLMIRRMWLNFNIK